MVKRVLLLVVLVVLFHRGAPDAHGQAYCALRDPTRYIRESYPEATSHRSIVRTVDESVRQRVADELPFTIHFNELGKHTLYLPVSGGRPLGLVHARSEAGRWGLVEIVWSLDPSLRVQGYSFQRCRARSRTAVETDAFKEQLVGMGSRQLRELLSGDGSTLAPGAMSIPPGAEDMAATLVRSALKTISVTRLVWARDLQIIRPLYHSYREFPATARVEQITTPYSSTVQSEIARSFPPANETTIDRQEVTMLRIYDASGATLGHLIRTPWRSLDREAKVWWSVSRDLVIKAVFPDEQWPDEEVEESFEKLEGLAMSNVQACSSATEVVGGEVLLLCRHN